MALRLEQGLGISTVGFIRNQKFNVYTWPERIAEVERGKSSDSK
ncbi:hypothetical protein HPY28_00755 [Brevibacillus sp. HB1.2]|nr:hypothetical protein [Brevibacillus sp. HB1.2]